MSWSTQNEGKYINEIEKLCALSDYENCNSNQQIAILKQKVMQAAGSLHHTPKNYANNKWLDLQCYNARKNVFKKLHLYRKHGGISTIRQEYHESRRQYVTLCAQKKKKYQNEMIEKLNHVKNSKEWWKLANELRNNNIDLR